MNRGDALRKFLVFSMLGAVAGPLAGCAGFPGMAGGQGPTTPATPVFFQPFSAALDQPALTIIAATAKAANAQPDAPITVTGAADSVGSTKANELLSQTRAQVVADALVTDGVAPSRITVTGIGESTTPATGAAAQFSRRALIQIGQ